MGQLITRQDYSRSKLMEIALVMKKVKIKLTSSQVEALGRIMSNYMANIEIRRLDEKAIFFLLYSIFEGKLRKKILSLQPEMTLSIDISQAWSLFELLQEMDLDSWPYENSVKELIIRQIDKQTA